MAFDVLANKKVESRQYKLVGIRGIPFVYRYVLGAQAGSYG